MTEIQFFEVGGCVRDEFLGKPSKDIDFSVISPSFEFMRDRIAQAGMKIVQDKPEFGTVRAVARTPFMGHTGGLDFVWARVDGPSSDGRRPDWTKPGSLMEDLARRDFTMNAMAKDEDGNIIDPFGGRVAIENRIITCVGTATERLAEDALRGLRAMRFAVTLDFDMSGAIRTVMRQPWFAEALSSVSKERQREEMEKMFSHNTAKSIILMQDFPAVMSVVFSNGLRLSATMKEG